MNIRTKSCFMRLIFLAWFVLITIHPVRAETPKPAKKSNDRESKVILPKGFMYSPEHIYDTHVYSDEALVNVQVSSHRWPNCTTLEQAIQDIFRLEGVANKSDQDKAVALWKWLRILVSSTGGYYDYEGAIPGKEVLVHDASKIFTVYGHHQCDGLSWVMVPLWRAAGYIAFDEASHGHTTASLRYRDHDGKMRFHSFDPQGRFFWWNNKLDVVGNRSIPIMQGAVHRHLTLSQKVHSLRTSLRMNETIERKWLNQGHVVVSGRQPKKIQMEGYYEYKRGKNKGIYASAGTEIQSFHPDLTPEGYKLSLFETSKNVAATSSNKGHARLHPENRGQIADIIYRLPSPYVGIDGTVEATLLKGKDRDICRLFLSRDGKNWEVIFDKKDIGEETVTIDLGRKAREQDRPHIYTAYTFFIKAELSSDTDVKKVGLSDLKIITYRMLNKRTLPNLLPGENYMKVTADSIRPGTALVLILRYSIKGKPFTETHLIKKFPYYFKIQIRNAKPLLRNSYDHAFGIGDIRMGSITMQLVNGGDTIQPMVPDIDIATAEKKFKESSPHPAGEKMIRRKRMKRPETDIVQTNGFFPQYTRYKRSEQEYQKLLVQFKEGSDSSPKRWRAAEKLGKYPQSLDVLLEALPNANLDLTLFICKALAEIKDKKAIGPLLEKWKMAPDGSPGTRYIPDVLAAIGDPSVVPELVAKLKHVRFDFRFHIVYALDKLGGPLAKRTLEDLAQHDPFPAVREEAKEALKRYAAVESKRSTKR